MPKQSISQEIITLFKKHGQMEYGEGFSVSSHSVQAGLLAKEKGYDSALIIAAFIHDIGHLYPLEMATAEVQKMGDFGIEAHDQWGEKFLRQRNFPPRVIAPVENHVRAKRYLCFKEPDYYVSLSEASKETLSYQGGPMSAPEAKAFASAPLFEESIKIRRIDDEAKADNFEVTASHWVYFAGLIDELAGINLEL